MEYYACVNGCLTRLLAGRRCHGASRQMDTKDSIKKLDGFSYVADADTWHSALFLFSAKFDLPLAPALEPIKTLEDRPEFKWLIDLYRPLPFLDDAVYAVVKERQAADSERLAAALLAIRPQTEALIKEQRFYSEDQNLSGDSTKKNPEDSNTDQVIWYETLEEFPGLPRLLGLEDLLASSLGGSPLHHLEEQQKNRSHSSSEGDTLDDNDVTTVTTLSSPPPTVASIDEATALPTPRSFP